MNRAIEQANKIHEIYGNDLDRIADSLGLNVIPQKMEGRLREFYFSGAIVINENLSSRERRELVAHAIGHHLLHAGNHLAMQKRIYSFGNYHEKQANVFAACLLMPLEELSVFISNKCRIDEIANHFQVREQLVRMRLKIWSNFEQDLTGRQNARVG
ncbi:MAG: ImmA/IrrE family metallo-endopeptidase [Thermoleophilia bacterium]